MYIDLNILFPFLCCFVILGLVLMIVLARQGSRYGRTPTESPTPPTRPPEDRTSPQRQFQAVEHLLETWVTQQRLPDDVRAQLVRLIEEDRAALREPPPAPVSPAVPVAAASLAPFTPSTPAPAEVPRSAMPAQPLPKTYADSEKKTVPALHPSRIEQFTRAVLALRTRLTLLFLGAFLLVVSALILVVFNWASFPPIFQFALLAGVCGGFWGGGFWMARQPELVRAGRGLQAVGGVLTPVVAFALSRPGLLDLGLREAWLLTSLLSLPVYLAAAWRLRQRVFAVAACVAAASAVLAGLRFVENQWLLVALLLVLISYLPLSRGLTRRGLTDLAVAPVWVAHAGVPFTLLLTLLLFLADLVSQGVLATGLWAGVAFYLLALLLELRPRWAWVTALLLPAALLVSLDAAQMVEQQWLPVALLLLLISYLPVSHLLLRRGLGALAVVPSQVAYIGVPFTLGFTLLFFLGSLVSEGVLATVLWGGVAFYLLAVGLEPQPRWAWVTALLLPAALLVSLDVVQVAWFWHGLTLALLALVYLSVGGLLEPRHDAYARPGYAGAAVLVPLALLISLTNMTVLRWASPVLILVGYVTMLATHRGRLAWLTNNQRLAVATTGLGLAGTLLTLWVLALFDLTTMSRVQRGLWLLPLAAGYFVSAYAWPGRLHRAYDWTLQTLGSVIVFGVSGALLGAATIQTGGMALVTLTWTGQTLLRRRDWWATLALGYALLTACLHLLSLNVAQPVDIWIWSGLGFTLVYAVGGTLLRRTMWRCWTWPGVGWATLTGGATLLLIILQIIALGEVMLLHVLAVGILTLLLGVMTLFWQRAWIGYPAALLLALTLLLASFRDFFVGWELRSVDYGYFVCGVTLLLVLLGQGIRRLVPAKPAYAYPYEVVGFVLLTFVPVPAAASLQHACLTWIAMTLLYSLATWRYRLPWAIAPAFVAADMGVLTGAGWLSPGGRPADAGLLLLGAAWVQAWIGFWARHRVTAPDPRSRWTDTIALPSFVVAGLSGLGALALASAASDAFTLVALGLALLVAVLGTLEQHEESAWGAVLLAGLGMVSLHQNVALDLRWSLAWGVFEALWLCLLGWLIGLLSQNATFLARLPGLVIWQRPTTVGALAVGMGLSSILLLIMAEDGRIFLSPLTFALVNLGLLLATLAVRQRTIGYAYGAGAALVGAALCQLYQWGFREPQWFTLPAGVYLLALAEGLRRFQGQHQLSRMIETGAVLLLLGTTLGQSLRADGLESLAYATWLCVAALLMLGYGMLRKLRVPFLGGMLFFVLGVLWLSVDPLRAANKWLLLGALGMVLVGVYVLLERRQEQLVRTGRIWFERVKGWG